jgi:hypothetical protein
MLHRFEGVLAGIIDLHGGARPAGRAWDVPATTVVSWLHGRHPSMVTLARVLAHLSPVQRSALFDALLSDAVGAVEANDLVPIDPARAVPYAAVTPAAKSAHALRLRVANLEAALDRAEADAADARREYRAARVGERTAVAVFIRREAERLKALNLANAIAIAALADAIEAGVHRPGGDP